MSLVTLTPETVNAFLKGNADPHAVAIQDAGHSAPFFQIQAAAGDPEVAGISWGFNANTIDPNTGLLLPSAVAGLWVKLPMSAVDTAGGVASWANPYGSTIMITRVLVNYTHIATAPCTLDIGVAANGTTLDDTLIDGLDVNGVAASLQDNMLAATQGTNGHPSRLMTASQFFTASVASGASAGLVGNIYLQWLPVS